MIGQTVHSLDPMQLLQRSGISPSSSVVCPQCNTGFVSASGVIFPAHFDKDGERHFGNLLFCSACCILGWLDPDHMYKA